ncbi:MAG: tetratricopeptide repeat protein [bacterium]|nr:tetratricopeptide repeat protein [bacterium]
MIYLSRLLVLVVVVMAGLPPALSQSSTPLEDADWADDLILQGKYNEALDYLGGRIRNLQFVSDRRGGGLLFAYTARAFVEIGRLDSAEEALHMAQKLANWDRFTPRHVVAREQAAFHLVRRDFPAAAKEASKAYGLARRRSTPSDKAAYCLALEALARLRMGDLTEAANRAEKALRGVSGKPNRCRFFEPRILYAKCIVQSHLGDSDEAVSYADRGLQLASHAGRPNNRDVVLGRLAQAEAYLQAGDVARGRAHGLQALEAATAVFGRSHPDVVSALELLTLAELKQGRGIEAGTRAREALALAREVFGQESPAVACLMKKLEEALRLDHRK